jgi:hypothetical protein
VAAARAGNATQIAASPLFAVQVCCLLHSWRCAGDNVSDADGM